MVLRYGQAVEFCKVAGPYSQPLRVVETANVPSVYSAATYPPMATGEKLIDILEDMRMAEQKSERKVLARFAGTYIDGIRSNRDPRLSSPQEETDAPWPIHQGQTSTFLYASR